MRRWLAVWLALMLVLSACGQGEADQESQRETADSETLAEEAGVVYGAITANETFTVAVEEPDGTATKLDITPDYARNVKGRASRFSGYQWSAASAEDWQSQLEGDRGNLLTVTALDGETVLACCSGGDIVYLRRAGEETWLRAVNPLEGEPYEGKLYDDLLVIAEDAVSIAAWAEPVDGELDVEAAAARLAGQIAENYQNVPAWLEWKPLDARVGEAEVYDVYRGEPEQFCLELDLLVLLDETALRTSYWNAGAGVQNQEADGWWHWRHEARVARNGDEVWVCTDWGTGGYKVKLPCEPLSEASLKELLDAFYLSEGLTRDASIADAVLERSAEALQGLPRLLDQRTEAEVKALCAALAARLDEDPNWITQTKETLGKVLGPYGAYLDT